MSKLISFFLLLFIFSNCKSLNQRKDTATAQILALQSGALLVRLPTNEAKIARLQKLGKPDAAKKEQAFTKQFHQDILRAFEERYNFSQVYFYYAEASVEIKKGNFDGNIFNAKWQNIDTLSFPKEHLFYAEFGFAHQDELTVDRDGKPTKAIGLNGTKALVIRTYEGIQPLRPFPYSVRYNYKGPSSLKGSVKKLNQELSKNFKAMRKRELRRKGK